MSEVALARVICSMWQGEAGSLVQIGFQDTLFCPAFSLAPPPHPSVPSFTSLNCPGDYLPAEHVHAPHLPSHYLTVTMPFLLLPQQTLASIGAASS